MESRDVSFKSLKAIDPTILPQSLLDQYDYLLEVTENFTTWAYYDADADIKKSFDQSMADIFKFEQEYKNPPKAKPTREPRKKVVTPKPTPVEPTKSVKRTPNTENEPQMVERIPEEIRFIKRYALLDHKVKTEKQILTFIKAIQKAILEKRIRKTSPFKDEISYIQENLITLYNKMKNQVEIRINEDVLEKFLTISGSQKILLSISYLKRYIGIQGKHIDKIKAQRLQRLIKNAVDKRQITVKDPYAVKLNEVFESLGKFINSAKKSDTLELHPAVLNGISQSLGCANCKNSCGCNLNGFDDVESSPPQNTVMNSADFAKMKFETLGFEGKWLKLIGDPSKGFSAMVFAKPKMGKSYLCIDFGGYLAKNHGKVLYVAKEEKFNSTLQKKLKDKDVVHPNFFVSDFIPEDLTGYDFVFLDSVNKLNLTSEELEELKAEYPEISFIFIFQTTKEGNFRGTNQFQHDVDVVIEIPEKGKAVQFGRFNQGGEIEVFENDYSHKDYY